MCRIINLFLALGVHIYLLGLHKENFFQMFMNIPLTEERKDITTISPPSLS